ncbi:MAG: hypothetical protein ACUVX1_13945 [Chloroflexota bacterium]
MLFSKTPIWIIAALTAATLSVSTVAAVPNVLPGGTFGDDNGSGLTMPKPVVGLMPFDQEQPQGLAKGDKDAKKWTAAVADDPDVDDDEVVDDDDEVTDDDDEAVDDEEDSSAPGQDKIAEAMAERFEVDEDTVGELRASGLGWGEIYHLLRIAEESISSADSVEATTTITDTLQTILEARDGQGLGDIAKQFGLHPGNKGNNLGSAVSGRAFKPTSTITGTLTTGEKVKGNKIGKANGKNK